MAKKDRVPTPPKRPVQAPKAYKPEASPRRTRLIFIGLAAAIVIAAGAIGAAFMLGSDDDASGPSTQGDCTLETFDALEASHVEELPDGYEYNSVPATSGLHNATPAIWNLYDQPVPEINSVHNLEHGGVLVQYGSEVPQEAIAKPRRLVPAGHPRPDCRASRTGLRGGRAGARRPDRRHLMDAHAAL